MTNFIYDNTSLPIDKINLNPLPPGANPRQWAVATEWITVLQGLLDVQAFCRGANWMGFTAHATDPSPSSIDNYLWIRSDGTLMKTILGVEAAVGGGSVSIGGTVAGGTTGSLLFVGAAAALSQDNANLFWNDAFNRLGIGTATPGTTLDISSATTVAGLALYAGSTTPVSAAGTGRFRFNESTNVMQVSLNGAAYVDLDTSAPFTIDIGDAIGSSTVGSLLFVGAGNSLQQDPTKLFWDDTNNRFTVGAGGITKVGFEHEFTKDAAIAVVASAYGTGLNAEFMAFRGRGTGAITTAVQSGDVLGAFSMAGATTATAILSGAYMRGLATENWSGTAAGTQIQFFTTANTTLTRTLRATVDQDGVLYVNGGGLISVITASGAGFFNSAMFTAGGASLSFAQADRELRIQQGANGAGQRYQYLTFNGRWGGNIDSPTLTQGLFDRVSGIEFNAAAQLGPNSNTSINFFVNRGAKSTGTETAATPTRAMSITYTGRVGLNNVDPVYQLDVEPYVATDNTNAKFGSTNPVYIISNSPNIGMNTYYSNPSGWKFGKGSVAQRAGVMSFDVATGEWSLNTSNATGSADAAITLINPFKVSAAGVIDLGLSGGTTSAVIVRGGSTAAVGAASTGRLRYNESTNKFQVSENGAAYADVLSGSSMAIGGAITSATAGSVLFAGAAGILQQDNANFFWDDTNNRLGIGTAGAPAFPLDVKGLLGNTPAKFGTDWPIALVSGTAFSIFPAIGFAAYYNGGWRFADGPLFNYAGYMEFKPDTTVWNFFRSNQGLGANTLWSSSTLMFQITASNSIRVPNLGVFSPGGNWRGIPLTTGDGTFVLDMASNDLVWDTNTKRLCLGTNPDWAGATISIRKGFALQVQTRSTVAPGATSGSTVAVTVETNPTGANQRLGGYDFGSYFVDIITPTYGASIEAFAEAAWTAGTSHPSYLSFKTTAVAAATPIERLRIASGGNVTITGGQLQVTRDHATDGQVFVWGANAGNTQPSAIGFLNQAASFRSYLGYFPSSYAFAHLQLLNGFFAQTGEDIAFANTTENAFRFGMTSGSAFVAVSNGGSAAVSAASTGRLRYNTTGQVFQASLNGAAYFNLPQLEATLTSGSIPFANSSGRLAQDNANLFWDDTNNALGLGTASPLSNYRLSVKTVTGGSGIQITGSDTAAYSGLDFYNPAGTFKGSVGYGNTTVAIAHVQDKLFHYSAGVDWVFANATRNEFTFGMTTGSAFMQAQNGSAAAVSDANTGRLRYNSGTQKFQVSLNGAAYVDIATGSGGAPSVEQLSVDGAASPTVDVAFVSGAGTDLTLANGSVDGFIKNFIITGGTGTITPANLADGNVLTWTATPANVSFIWDATNTTWHVTGNPYNMVTT